MNIQKALQQLITKGAHIEQIEADKFMIYDNGFWGFCSDENPFIIDGNELIELYNEYILN